MASLDQQASSAVTSSSRIGVQLLSPTDIGKWHHHLHMVFNTATTTTSTAWVAVATKHYQKTSPPLQQCQHHFHYHSHWQQAVATYLFHPPANITDKHHHHWHGQQLRQLHRHSIEPATLPCIAVYGLTKRGCTALSRLEISPVRNSGCFPGRKASSSGILLPNLGICLSVIS